MIQLSSYLWMRNNDLAPLLEDPYREPHLSNDDKRCLKKILDEIDDIHSGSTPTNLAEALRTQRDVTIVEKSRDPQLSGKLFEQIHNILKNYLVDPEVYRRLGRAFEEIGVQPSQDTAEAIEYAVKMYHRNNWPNMPRSRVCWEVHNPRKQKYSA